MKTEKVKKRIKKLVKAGEKTRFPKGTSGNPKGKPKGTRSVAVLLRELMQTAFHDGENILTGEKTKLTGAQAIAAELFKTAMEDPNKPAMARLLDRVYGTPIPITEMAETDDSTDDKIAEAVSSDDVKKKMQTYIDTMKGR